MNINTIIKQFQLVNINYNINQLQEQMFLIKKALKIIPNIYLKIFKNNLYLYSSKLLVLIFKPIFLDFFFIIYKSI